MLRRLRHVTRKPLQEEFQKARQADLSPQPTHDTVPPIDSLTDFPAVSPKTTSTHTASSPRVVTGFNVVASASKPVAASPSVIPIVLIFKRTRMTVALAGAHFSSGEGVCAVCRRGASACDLHPGYHCLHSKQCAGSLERQHTQDHHHAARDRQGALLPHSAQGCTRAQGIQDQRVGVWCRVGHC